ncbi:hypothetical protein SAMN05421538_1023 [Paracoccus isoporae]|uniref:Uncharacterized protein n=1 Tax=Paracoccus isoporae TaxID=591205 RepID=A0A1G6W0V7_9RHOB|nr:hypothetical protein [Paracoccus isoporae]SDD59449.1 hypothetical protein SAMN05421538_1023 [Paracoccus isoporae]
MSNIWSSLSEAQAIIINGVLTVFAAAVGVLLGRLLFSGKVKNITEAIEASQQVVDTHLSKMDETLEKINDKANGLDEILSAVTERLNKTAYEADLGDEEVEGISERVSDLPQTHLASVVDSDNGASRDEIRSLWRDISDYIEEIASNPAIDGRTRAKYFRIDRRAYRDLINALLYDDRISKSTAEAAEEAYALRNSFRRRELDPTKHELDRMKQLKEVVLAQESEDA